ncbi:DUF445 domain-containing protein [Desulfoplanes formicivorans]|uniref:DUF445 domain-containing protein n=1 Tax=Desulfoplanes formicivorans TaxID=1592317 RepID=A0A194AFE2_9BACT|nr:DUF445 family protein [Desulfoplanes formicivorans]GAU07499.1 hypothetical protein DPF_0184 [Desulfoplanes formicivorans]
MKWMMFVAAPVICAFIGWLTNYLAVKMLFHPRKPIKIFSLTIQGIFPKRKKALAANLAMMVQDNLISEKDVAAVIDSPEFAATFREMIQEGLETFVREKLVGIHPMVGMFLNDETMEKIRGLLASQLDEIVPQFLKRGAQEVEDRFDVARLVREKVEGFSMDQLELLLVSIMQKEFRFIELVGAVLGFVIGIFQSLFFLLGGSL